VTISAMHPQSYRGTPEKGEDCSEIAAEFITEIAAVDPVRARLPLVVDVAFKVTMDSPTEALREGIVSNFRGCLDLVVGASTLRVDEAYFFDGLGTRVTFLSNG
jgi:hypothetical protein